VYQLPVTVVGAMVEDERWNRVYVGAFATQKEAEAALARLAAEGKSDGASVRQMGNERIMH
jgi:cell division protein FtsN